MSKKSPAPEETKSQLDQRAKKALEGAQNIIKEPYDADREHLNNIEYFSNWWEKSPVKSQINAYFDELENLPQHLDYATRKQTIEKELLAIIESAKNSVVRNASQQVEHGRSKLITLENPSTEAYNNALDFYGILDNNFIIVVHVEECIHNIRNYESILRIYERIMLGYEVEKALHRLRLLHPQSNRKQRAFEGRHTLTVLNHVGEVINHLGLADTLTRDFNLTKPQAAQFFVDFLSLNLNLNEHSPENLRKAIYNNQKASVLKDGKDNKQVEEVRKFLNQNGINYKP
jgi:hypothetical protein